MRDILTSEAFGTKMAWNEIPAKDDPDLLIQAYYARLNILGSLMGPFSRDILANLWRVGESREMKELYRSHLIGGLASDLIRACAIEDVAHFDPKVGDWFIHCGETTYVPLNNETKTAEIRLRDGSLIRGTTRRDCEITTTASVNMYDVDDISLVVGRMISSSKFDLVIAGVREIMHKLTGREGRVIDLTNRRDTLVSNGGRQHYLPRLEYEDFSNKDALMAAVNDTADQFKVAVRDRGAWKHLYDSAGNPEHESRHQALYRLFASLAFDALGIEVHPNADHGSGPTDLTLALNGTTCVIEFKKDRELRKLRHGILVQLPQYMRSANAEFGTYLVMCHERDPDLTEQQLNILVREQGDPSYSISAVAVDCRKRKSASKIGL
ncbi:hypothetical protein ACGFNP_42915 [Nonomuraea sp. NPDC049269]|uniref:hypothetical protein n=1 Tax=Nonomuraea sp. NPDC049269 TaxID=3364349 RepID=UPI003721BD23